MTIPTDLGPDPTAALAALPAGAIWDGKGLGYLVPAGLEIRQPVRVQNATFVDPSTGPTQHPGEWLGVKPVISIRDTHDVTLSNVTAYGANGGKMGYHAKLVGQAGIDARSIARLTLENVAIANTFGDGLTLVADQPKDSDPMTDLAVTGLSITCTGRQGITVSNVQRATFVGVDISQTTEQDWDFESDLAGVGSGNIEVQEYHGQGHVRLIEALQGPVTFSDSDCSGISLTNSAAASGQSVAFHGGTLTLRRIYTGVPPAGIWISGPGNLLLDGVRIVNAPGRIAPGPGWVVTNGGHLTLMNCDSEVPLGTQDATSSVVVS